MSTLTNCIEPYTTNIDIQNASKLVVFGQLSDQEGYQTIAISMSASIDKPIYTPIYSPISNCIVKVIDNHGNTFDFIESEKGNYQCWMDKEYLNPGTEYKVNIITPTGVEIASSFEQMPECPDIDSIYYLRKDIQTANPQKPLQGIQFYIDIDGGNTGSKLYRWDIIETWEHHASYPITWLWNRSTVVKITPTDFSLFKCWSTKKVVNVFTLNTEDLAQNSYKMYKLHFVDNLSQRLTFCYSINVIQYSLTKSAFEFWEKLRKNNNENGGLYNAQPMHVKGNLICTSNPEQEILGFFTASPSRAKRIFARNIENLELFYQHCEPAIPDKSDFSKYRNRYLVNEGEGLRVVEDVCVECTLEDQGTTTKPNYWPY